jgi:DNA replication protein DnaC
MPSDGGEHVFEPWRETDHTLEESLEGAISPREQGRREAKRMREDPAYAERIRRETEAAIAAERAKRRAEILREAEAELRERRREMLPKRVAMSFEGGLEESTAVRAARAHAKSDRTVLVLGGDPGVGKSVGAATLMHKERRVHVDLGETCVVPRLVGRFIHAMDLARPDSYGRDAVAFWAELEDEEVLVIDELGGGISDGKYFLANLANLICRRYDECLETVFTTNLAQDVFVREFLSHDGGRILNRFREGGLFHWCTGPSFRMRPGVTDR